MKEHSLKHTLQAMFKGLVISYIITFGVLIITSLLITYTSVTEAHTSVIALAAALVSVFVCGFITAASAKCKGWLWGLLSGIMYTLIMITIGFLTIEGYTLGTRALLMGIASLTGGFSGGILGINKT